MTEYTVTAASVTAIGKGEETLSVSADAIVAATPETFDYSKRGAVAELLRKHVEPGQRKRGTTVTRYGKGFSSLESAVKARLRKRDGSAVTDWLRLVEQASKNATDKGQFSVEDILAAAKRGTSTDDNE